MIDDKQLKEEVDKVLNDGLDKSEEERKKLREKSDISTASHGIKGEAPQELEERRKTIQTNFYGTAVQYFALITSYLETINEKIEELQEKNK